MLKSENINDEKTILKIKDNNTENKDDYTTNYYHNGTAIKFELNFELRKLSKSKNLPYYTDKISQDNLNYKKYFTDTLLKNYYYKNITKHHWEDLYDLQFEIFERLYTKFDLGLRLILMNIFTKDLLWQNYFPLNKLILRQIIELRKIEWLEEVYNGPIQNNNEYPFFKYLNYKGGIPTQNCVTYPLRDIRETIAVDNYLEKFELELLQSQLKREAKTAELRKEAELNFIHISDVEDSNLIEQI
jgi:hypothetical protein